MMSSGHNKRLGGNLFDRALDCDQSAGPHSRQADWSHKPDIHHLAKMMSLIRILPVAQLAARVTGELDGAKIDGLLKRTQIINHVHLRRAKLSRELEWTQLGDNGELS